MPDLAAPITVTDSFEGGYSQALKFQVYQLFSSALMDSPIYWRRPLIDRLTAESSSAFSRHGFSSLVELLSFAPHFTSLGGWHDDWTGVTHSKRVLVSIRCRTKQRLVHHRFHFFCTDLLRHYYAIRILPDAPFLIFYRHIRRSLCCSWFSCGGHSNELKVLNSSLPKWYQSEHSNSKLYLAG